MDIFARDLKVGDEVNCHEQGWLIVKEAYLYKLSMKNAEN